MGGCRCSYKNCSNTTKTTDNIHFFHYPVKHRERCVQWIENACKPNFYDLEEDQLRNKVVCELHFEAKWFPNSQRKRLLQGAVPTLDGDCNDISSPMSPMETETPMYFPSNQYSDVKVLPANEDGTVFILDTENMFTVSSKIESYIIKNGVLVPTNSNNATPKPTKLNSSRFKPSTSNSAISGFYSASETEITNINTPPGLPGPSKLTEKEPTHHRSSIIKKEEVELPEVSLNSEKPSCNINLLVYDNNEHHQRFEVSTEPGDRKPDPVTMSRQNQAQASQKTMVTKNYLRKIKQHSRDIATIKRMLKQKRMVEHKPNIRAVLNVLQEQIPSTLFSVVSLLLGEKNELTEDDVEFFTTLHRVSPQVYQLLSEKYKWNLPSVDVVDAPTE